MLGYDDHSYFIRIFKKQLEKHLKSIKSILYKQMKVYLSFVYFLMEKRAKALEKLLPLT